MMTYTVPALRHRLRSLALLLLLAAALPQHALARGDGDKTLTTKYFTITYPAGEEKTADWYASFADEVDAAVSELLGADPVQNLSLHIYATEAEYTQANPMAELHPGIMAHAVPQDKAIGVAVERLRDAPPELARESFRHEVTHVVAGDLSNQNLPVGFQEGLAQYNELSSSRGEEVAQTLQAAQEAGAQFLSWFDLNNRRVFQRRLDIAYPESYSVMAFLADRYGMGKFSHFMDGLRRNLDYGDALANAYGKPVPELEQEWRDYLPGFYNEGWKLNVLGDYDLSPGIALYEAGRFKEAQERFARSERVYTDLGRTNRAAEASEYRAKAKNAQQAEELAGQARRSLEGLDYSTALQGAQQAGQAFADQKLPNQQQRVEATAQLAGRGLDALTALQQARSELDSFNFPRAQADARRAGEAFAMLGDAPRVGEVNDMLKELAYRQRLAGSVALGGGGLAVLLGIMAARRYRRRARAKMPIQLQEESASWL